MTELTESDMLRLVSLTKRHANLVAVDNVDLTVAKGEFLTLLGPSGSGKTTTLMMIAGFTGPSAGDVQIEGKSVVQLPPEKRNIGVVFQNYALFPHMSTFENVAFPLKMRGMSRSMMTERVAWALSLVRMENLGERLPRQLSGGQQQRVALARALVFQPSILLMDEALGALDKNLREQMKVELKRLHRELRSTIVYVTHDQEEALMMSDRVALMNHGRIEQIGSAMDLYERPRNRFVAEFIGEANILVGRLESTENGAGAIFCVSSNGIKIGIASNPIGVELGQPCLLVLRPERIGLAPERNDQDRSRWGTVVDQSYVGDTIRYHVRMPGDLLFTVNRQNVEGVYRPKPGEVVHISCAPSDVCVLPT